MEHNNASASQHARSPWLAWLQKPSQWRWTSTRRSLLYISFLMMMVLAFEAVWFTGEHQPFLLRSAMRIHTKLRYPVDAGTVVANANDSDVRPYYRNVAASSGITSTNAQHSNSTNIIKSAHANQLPKECSPQTVDPEMVGYPSHDAFHLILQSVWTRVPSPVFQGDAVLLCDEMATGKTRLWDYCLPISGLKDVSSCYGKERHDLLQPQSPASLCFNSALHMLTVDVYDEMKRLDLHPALLYGTLLGAIRDGLTIAFTEDADIGFNALGDYDRLIDLKKTLVKKGYHMFYHKIWRVCVASTHPLAFNLYNPQMDLLRGAWDAPYVDLYEMKVENETTYRVDAAVPSPMISRNKIEPFSHVTLHGLAYDTVADPQYLLQRESERAI